MDSARLGAYILQRAHYGAPGDFDQWGDIAKDDAWAYKNFSRCVLLFGSFFAFFDIWVI
jgi:hypothetical protein